VLALKTWLGEGYLWIKAIHMIAVVCWMAGLFYLPRLFVYHVGVHPESEAACLFKIMEYRLYKIIMVPSMLLSLAFGFLLVMVVDVWTSGWFYIKAMCVIGLMILQHLLNNWRKQLASGKCTRTAFFFRMINEVPPILLILVIISVIVKPF
jgi:putative membrane protein